MHIAFPVHFRNYTEAHPSIIIIQYTLVSDLVDQSSVLLGRTGQHILVLALKGKEVPSRRKLAPHGARRQLAGIVMDQEVCDLLPGSVKAPLAELVVPAHAVD